MKQKNKFIIISFLIKDYYYIKNLFSKEVIIF